MAVEQRTFERIKEMLTAPTLLVHGDERKPLMLSCDVFPLVLGQFYLMLWTTNNCLCLVLPEHSDKEAIAILFGVSKFHHYLYGRHFTIHSDHKPLMHIFNQSKAVPVMVSARLQRLALILSSYHYSIKYRKGSFIQ